MSCWQMYSQQKKKLVIPLSFFVGLNNFYVYHMVLVLRFLSISINKSYNFSMTYTEVDLPLFIDYNYLLLSLIWVLNNYAINYSVCLQH